MNWRKAPATSRNESAVSLWKMTKDDSSNAWFNDCNISRQDKQILQSQMNKSGGTTPAVVMDPDTMEARLQEATETVLQLTAGGVEEVNMYPDSLSFMLGEDFMPEVAAVELKTDEVLAKENHDDFKKAHLKEIAQMTKRRFVRPGSESAKSPHYVPADQLTEEQKKKALPCRMSYTRKRPDGAEEAAAKARLVAKDLKVRYTKPKEVTYSGVPTAEGFRLVVASTDVEKGDELSSTDFDTAFLQSFKWKDGRLVLIVYWDPFTQSYVYEWIDGVIYGMQEGSCDWQKTLAYIMTTHLNFKKVKNMESMYYNTEHQVTVPCHVDDPLVKARGSDNTEWFHREINKVLDTKGRRTLSPSGKPLDYLSINISQTAVGDICLDNKIRIADTLKKMGLNQCNPVKEPITKPILKSLSVAEKESNYCSKDEHSLAWTALGDAQWLSQTTHPGLATAVSLYSSYMSKGLAGSLDAMKHLWRYISSVQDHCLIKRKGNNEGLVVWCDGDWAGLYTLTGEKRSRSGILITYDGMPVAWKSAFQQCKGTMAKDTGNPEDMHQISTSSGESEVHAASDAAKLAQHLKFVCEEINIPCPTKVPINIDAGAAIGFITNTCSIGRMKHIDLRESWVEQLRNKDHLEWVKVPGPENRSDTFTKIRSGADFARGVEGLMVPLPNQGGMLE